MIETFVSWFLGVISNGIGEKSKRKREIKNLQDSTRQEVVREVKNDLLACIEEMNEQFKDFEKLREKGFHSSCDEFIEFCNQYIEDHSYHTAKYKKLEMDLPDDGGLDELLQIVKMEKFCLDITSKNVMSDVYFQTLDEEKKILLVQMENDPKMASKPEKVREGIVTGKLGKFYKENCLLQQEFVKDSSVSVEQYMANAAKVLGGTITLKNAVRFEKGEGIEKKQENFAEEIAKQLGK